MPTSEIRVESSQERQFFQALRRMHRQADSPSSRALATKIGGMSHTTVNSALRGQKVPTWPVVAKIVDALGGDVEVMRQLWMEAQEPPTVVIPADESEIQVFVSYARIDDQATYERISKLIADTANTYQSMTGRSVGVFKDVDSIRPGENWRDRIRAGLSYSSIFLAFITPAYLRSPNCREELSEYLAFLTASSAERLVIPLIFAPRSRLEENFSDDELWMKIAQRHAPDISSLRYAEPGSAEWIQATEDLADRIEQILSTYKRNGKPVPTKVPVQTIEDTAPPGTLERMATIEEKLPQVVSDMEQVSQLLSDLGEAMAKATPGFAKATSFKARVAASRVLAKKLDPIADELSLRADRLVSNFSEWDFLVQYLLQYGHSGGDLRDPEFVPVLAGLWTMAKVGQSSLAEISGFAQMVSQGIGVSRELDRPFMAIRDAALRIADLSGILDGWQGVLKTLESEFLGEGYLDGLPADFDGTPQVSG